MNKTERWLIAWIIAICASICVVCFAALITYNPPEKYQPPCRTVGHLEIPEEKCK